MTEAVFFVVERSVNGGEVPVVYVDRLPARLTRKFGADERNPIVYALRLDLLPEAQTDIDAPLGQLYAVYKRLRDSGTLPASNLVPKQGAST